MNALSNLSSEQSPKKPKTTIKGTTPKPNHKNAGGQETIDFKSQICKGLSQLHVYLKKIFKSTAVYTCMTLQFNFPAKECCSYWKKSKTNKYYNMLWKTLSFQNC